MKNKSLLLLALLPSLIGCNKEISNPVGVIEESEDGKVVTVYDMQARKNVITKENINRVICLGAGALRYFTYVGDISKLVGIEKIDGNTFGIGNVLRPYYDANKTYFQSITEVTRGGPQDIDFNEEKLRAIMEVEPDLILSFYANQSVNDRFQSAAGIPVISLAQGSMGLYSEQTKKSLNIIGHIFNTTAKSDALINYINTSKDDFKNLTFTTEKYFASCIGNWGSYKFTGSFNSYPVFNVAKATNVIDSIPGLPKNTQVDVDLEKLIAAQPDKIFLDAAGFNDFISEYKENPAKYSGLNALTSGETYLLLPYNAYYTNLEIQLMSTYYVASVSHPEAFPDFDFEAKCNEITTKFLGKNYYEEMKSHPYGFGGYQKININDYL